MTQCPTDWPLITVVTPSFNQGKYIEATIRSVLWQDYPNLEYIVIDGGSTDDSVGIIRKYESHLALWVSEKDRGQSHAINKGFESGSGEIMAWLNSDDFYLPGALKLVATRFCSERGFDVLSGGGIAFEDSSRKFYPVRPCGLGIRPTLPIMLVRPGYVVQHSTFWSKRVWDDVGVIDEQLHYAMDHEFFTRVIEHGWNFQLVSTPFGAFRRYKGQKTSDGVPYYVEEARACRASVLSQPRWQKTTGRLRLKFANWSLKFARHRNIHPRLGLAPKCDEELIRCWIDALHA